MKYDAITDSLAAEIKLLNDVEIQAARKRESAKLARVQQTQTARREGVYRTRVALSDRESAAKIAQLDGFVATASDKGSAYLQSSAAATALFNKWGSLGVANRTLLWRAFDDLANAAAWQVERGDWKSANSTAEKLLTLELFEKTPGDAQTGKARIELGVDAKDLRLPSTAVGLTMQREGKEPAAATRLAQAWLSKLPAYVAGSATREEKLRAGKLSQLLDSEVFGPDTRRTQTIAVAVDALRGTYGPGALPVLAGYERAVEAAKRERVARQIAAFSSPSLPYRAPDNPVATGDAAPNVQPPLPYRAPDNPVAANPVEADVPQNTGVDTGVGSAQAPTEPPVSKPLVPAVDFVMRSYLNAKKVRLSDFRGKTVLLHFWNLPDERNDMSPTPVEKLFAITKRYDPQKIVLVLVSENGSQATIAQNYQELTDPTPDPERDRARNHGPRLYPKEAFSLVMGSYAGSPGFYAERAVADQALDFYTNDKNGISRKNRVTVINPAGQVVGTLVYGQDVTATEFNRARQGATGYAVYDFDEAALEDLLVRAMGPQP